MARHREITSKAVSAILLLLLKWFKASRMLVDAIPGVKLTLCFRYHQVSALGDPSDRFELPAVDPEDVWLPRSAEYSADAKRMGRPQVGRCYIMAFRNLTPPQLLPVLLPQFFARASCTSRRRSFRAQTEAKLYENRGGWGRNRDHARVQLEEFLLLDQLYSRCASAYKATSGKNITFGTV